MCVTQNGQDQSAVHECVIWTVASMDVVKVGLVSVLLAGQVNAVAS